MDLSKLPRLSRTDVQPGSPVVGPESGDATTSAAAPGGFPVVMNQAAAPPPDHAAPTAAAAASSFCNHCGAPLRPGARFCDSCGAPTVAAVPDYARGPEPGAGAEVWVSIIIGLVLVFMSPRIWQYLLMRGRISWTFQDEGGNPLPYPKSVFFWGDIALAAFALTLIMEGVVLGFVRRPLLIAVAFGLTVVTTVLNFLYVAWMIGKGYGLQLFSGLAVAFGVYIAVYEWRLLQHTKRARA